VRAFSLAALNPDEAAYYIPEHATLVVADALIGAGAGRLRVSPASWSEGGGEGLRAALRRLLDLPLERVLVSHGPPVLSGGRRALEDALESPEWGSQPT
jgi:glyoxylase-like metal-dependent hydrolase (beta-lactamase superfamily II)